MSTTSDIGPELAGLEFQRKLGSGGFSDVYLYERQRPRMQVAVKVLKADIMDAAQQAQFVAEADTMGELAEHPYIVPVLGAGTAPDGRPYLEMRYYPGPDLAERVKAQPLSVPDAIKMGIQLASAIETAHRAGIIHRDIKPQNVLISSYGVPGLTDFGIAGRPGEVEEDENVGVSMPWSPPEVLTGTSNGSQASDVYSLGATIWNLLVGRSPFSLPGDDNSQRALFTRIVHSKPPMTGRADVPSSLERILAQAMAKKPEHRPRTAFELARHLQRVEQELRLARTEIVVLEQPSVDHTASVGDLASHTPTSTVAPTGPAPSEDRTTLRPTAPPAPPAGDPTTRRPARATTPAPSGDAPTSRRPARASTPAAPPAPAGDAPTARRPARASTPAPAAGDAPTARRPARASTPAADPGAAPTARRPARPQPAPAAAGASAGSSASTPPAPPTGSDASGSSSSAPSHAAERSSGGRWVAIGGVAVLLAAAIGIGALLSRGGSEEHPEPGTTQGAPGPSDAGDLGIDLTPPPTPEPRVAKATDTQVTFEWDSAQKGDTWLFQVTDRNGTAMKQWQPTDKPRAVVAALPDGTTCILVETRRGSQSSSAGRTCKVAGR